MTRWIAIAAWGFAASDGAAQVQPRAVPELPAQVIDAIQPEDIADFPPSNLAQTLIFKHLPSAASIRSRAEQQYPRVYEDVARELSLSEAAQQQLISLLIDQHVEALRPGLPPDLSEAEVSRSLAHQDERHRRELARLLGDEGVAGLARYRQTIEPRFEVDDMREVLEAYDLSLTESQRRHLVEEILKPGVFQYGRDFSESEDIDAVRDEVRARVERNDEQLLTLASQILSPEQLARYALYQQERRADTIRYHMPDLAADAE